MRLLVLATFAALAAGCLTRPVIEGQPTTSAAVIKQVKQTSIDKVDLLFAIDNSASMGDKQDLLASAVPVLVNRLLNPNCVSTTATCSVASDCTTALGPTAQCDAGKCFVAGDNLGGTNQCSTIAGTEPEFPPVHDLHVGIVSSSLGGGGATDVCAPIDASDSTHQDDQGHLLDRTLGGSIANANPIDGSGGSFLAWLPPSDPKNGGKPAPNVTPYATSTDLVSDFQKLVQGVQQHGCGLEAQLESWYRFLVQPDPWKDITLTNDSVPRAQYDGVDAVLLKMRHDFLRPDSLVAIIQLTDEEDSWSDPMWGGGYGWTARTSNFPGGPNDGSGVGPRGTHECDTNPNDPDCTSCAFVGQNKPASGQPIAADPNCNACAAGASTCKPGWWTPATTPQVPIAAADGLNVRYGEQTMRRRYGFDNQHNVQRYVDGLRSPHVPDRDGESHDHESYAPTRSCTNPLFAAELPDGSDTSPAALCNLKPGQRQPDLVFYALIGGVPNDLVEGASGIDWTKVLGKDPEHYDTTGIDPRMIESTAPRPGVTSGEWNTLTSTAQIDLEYACTFDLPQPKDCTLAANQGACDCTGSTDAPLCSSQTPTTQIKGKAYPTIRELRVAKALGQQAVVASLCAKVVTGDANAPAYGYNPVMQAIVNRLKTQLGANCLPEPLKRASDGTVPCLLLTVYPGQTDQSAGCTDPGMCNPANPSTCGCAPNDATCTSTYQGILKRWQTDYQAQSGDAGASQPLPVACVFQQLTGAACTSLSQAGWCYVEGAQGANTCAQAIEFGAGGPPPNTITELECIEPN
jgi:hypothetical protein